MNQHKHESILIGGHPLSGLLHGAEYRVSRLSGWWERPAVKRNAISRELSDGDFLSPWHYEPRYITIGGLVDCTNHRQMHHIMDQLNGLAAARREWLSIQGHGPLASALVEADDQPVLTPLTDKLLRYSLYFKASDPRKYGEQRTADVGHDWTTLRHYGNYPAIPSFELYLTDVGDNGYQLSGEYPDGERRVWWYFYWGNNIWHSIDFATSRHVTLNGYFPERVRYSETFEVPPHTYVRTRARPHAYDQDYGPGSVEGTVSWRDTWI